MDEFFYRMEVLKIWYWNNLIGFIFFSIDWFCFINFRWLILDDKNYNRIEYDKIIDKMLKLKQKPINVSNKNKNNLGESVPILRNIDQL